jgi:hypothetical protein
MGRGRERVEQARAREGPEQATEQPQQQHQAKPQKAKYGAGSMGAFYRQGLGELGQLVQAFPGDIKPVETANTIWGQNPTPRDSYESKHGPQQPTPQTTVAVQEAAKDKAAEKQKQIEPEPG